MPPALVIVAAILAFAPVAAALLPAGSYERVERLYPELVRYTVAEGDTVGSVRAATGGTFESIGELRPASDASARLASLVPGEVILVPRGGLTRSAVVPGSYARVAESERGSAGGRLAASAGDAVLAPIRGFVDKAQIIGFVVLLGGAFGVILATGAIDAGLKAVVSAVGRGRARGLVIPVVFALFSLGGAVFGMGESTIAFVLITVPLAVRLGYDTITGVAMCYMASQVGFGGAFFNPFTVGIAQGIAELPYLSGLWVRVVVWAVVTAVGIGFTSWWAARVERDPSRSPTFALDEAVRGRLSAADAGGGDRVGVRRWLVTAAAFGSIFVSGYGVARLGWYIDEMAGLFVACGLMCGALSGFGPGRIAGEFVEGAKTMAEPALIIALSAGVVIVLERGLVLDTILHGLASPLGSLPGEGGAVALMGVQALLNFFVPSGSGQAAMTMPIVTPLCDLISLHRQVGVLAYQFGDGFSNLIIPTSAVLMGVLGAARVPWGVWARWVLPLVVVLYAVGAAALVVAARLPEAWLS